MDYEGAFFNINDYELTKENLGEGAFGAVYVAKSKKDGKNYAVKVIKTEQGFNGNQQMQLMRESMILRDLHHPSIVQFIGINFQSFKDPNKLEPSIITEYLSNGSLKDVLDKEKQSIASIQWDGTKKYISLLGIASAMKYLHQNKIIHRDLKPQNILMDENYNPRVCDFGLSRCLPDSYTKSMNLGMTGQIGTPLYMAPELLRGEIDYDPSVDVYAFAILAYEIVTGKEPYYELGPKITSFLLASKVMSGYRPKFTNDATEKMINLLSRCWSDNVSERPSFDEIYSLLSNDFSYLNEPIDKEEVNEFIDNTLNQLIKNSKYDPNEDFFVALGSLHGCKKNKSEAISILKTSSKKGSALSSHLLGLLYESGEIESDFEKAEYYYKKSAEQGNSNALQRLGYCYTFGSGVKIDYSKAFDNIQKAAELGNSRALCNLGQCYQKGYGVEKDGGKAFEFISKSAELGNSTALSNLASCYEKGCGVKQDYNKAMELFEKAAELGSSSSLCNIALFYEKGKGIEKNMEKAIDYYKEAVKLGNTSALNNLAQCYKKGDGVEKDYNKAIELYEKAGELGNATAFYNHALLYERGTGVEKDYKKAIELYEKAGELGYASAYKNIAICYEKGKGVEKDYTKAVEYYEKAAELGNASALNNLGQYYKKGNGVEKNITKAIEFYEKAAELGNVTALYNLGDLYEYGIGVEINKTKAKAYYEKAATLDNKDAQDAQDAQDNQDNQDEMEKIKE